MLWWSWSWGQRLALFVGVLGVAAALTWWGLGGAADGAAFLGGCAFFAIPLLTSILIFVGLRTGFIPSRGGRICRAEEPVTFWFVIGMQAAVLIVCLYAIWVMFLRD
jgi:hypothetical protein